MGFFSSLFGRRPDPEMANLYGSGHLYTEGVDNLNGMRGPYGCNGIVLGTNGLNSDRGALWLPEKDQGHTFTIGATRSGKFVSLLAPALMTYCGGVVVIDPKAESAWASADRRRAMGQRVVILDPWEEVNRRYGDLVGVKEAVSKFNPLAHLDPRHPDFGDEVASLADALVITQGNESQPHFPDSARDFIAGVIAAVVEHAPGLATFADVRETLTLSDDLLATVVKRIIRHNPHGLAARKLGRFVQPGNNELASIRSTAATQTAMLDTMRLLSAMATTENAFDMAELGTSKVSLFIILPMGKLQTHGRWLRLILTLAIRAITNQARPPSPPVLFMLDEMGTVGKLDIVENAVGLLAGQGIRIWGFLQDLKQLQDDYGKWETFLANSSNILLLGVNDVNTSEYFSKHMGTKTISHLANTYTGGHSGTSGNSGWSQAFQYHQRPVMLPVEIMQKPGDTLLILRQGGPNLQLKKAVYHKEHRWQGLYRNNPGYLPPHLLRPQPPRIGNPPVFPPPIDKPHVEPPRVEKLRTAVLRCTSPACRTSLRVPVSRGAGWITCPACRNRWLFRGE